MTTTESPPGIGDAQRLAALEKLFRRIGDVSSLPTVVVRIIEVVNDETTGTEDLLAAIGGDPALAARILRTVNAASYGLRRTVTDLKSAVRILGFREVRNLAFTIYVARSFRSQSGYRHYSRESLWNHMVAVASAAKLVAKTSGKACPEEAYLAGLLHDMGLILIDQHIHHRFCKVIDALSESTPTCAAERRELTFDHTELGEFVAKNWHFPPLVCDAIRWHHAPHEYHGEFAPVVESVAIANYLVTRQGLPSLGVANVTMPSSDVFAALSLGNDQLRSICDQLEQSLEAANTITGV